MPDDTAAPLCRYVVLWHEGVAEPHFDLMIETLPGQPLRTWRLSAWPITAGANHEARELAPHRADYLTYEGPLSGGRGSVRRVAAGSAPCNAAQDYLRLALPEGSIKLARDADDRWEVSVVS